MLCDCGCGKEFEPRRTGGRPQKFITGHREPFYRRNKPVKRVSIDDLAALGRAKNQRVTRCKTPQDARLKVRRVLTWQIGQQFTLEAPGAARRMRPVLVVDGLGIVRSFRILLRRRLKSNALQLLSGRRMESSPGRGSLEPAPSGFERRQEVFA